MNFSSDEARHEVLEMILSAQMKDEGMCRARKTRPNFPWPSMLPSSKEERERAGEGWKW